MTNGRIDAGAHARPRAPGMVYVAATLVLLLLLGMLALSIREPPPPTITEFAPQAVEQITDRLEDFSRRANAPGSVGLGGASARPEAGALNQAIDVPRVRKCVGDPPRQIEDPQSPPCVPYWSGDNGGATSKGVTRDEIRIAFAAGSTLTLEQSMLVAFFNKRFEFYGRKLNLVPFAASGDADADAVAADEEHHGFAAAGYSCFCEIKLVEYFNELARRHIVSAQGSYVGINDSDEKHVYAAFDPYEWNYLPTVDKLLTNVGQFYCGSLARRPPAYAGVPQSLQSARKLGVLVEHYSDGRPPPDIGPLDAALASCGVRSAAVVAFDPGSQSLGPAEILQLINAGVTSVLCLCPSGPLAQRFMPGASAQGYYPEWLVTNYGHQDDDLNGSLMPSDQAAHAFGFRSWNKSVQHEQMPYSWALKEMDPSYSPASEANRGAWWDVMGLYWNLLVLSSGFQMAGPRLTPQTFGAALFRTRFANPSAGAAPYYQGTVGFGQRLGAGQPSHSFVQDFAPIWWSSSERSQDFFAGQSPVTYTQGAFCYVFHGARFGAGQWPSGTLPFFKTPCR